MCFVMPNLQTYLKKKQFSKKRINLLDANG